MSDSPCTCNDPWWSTSPRPACVVHMHEQDKLDRGGWDFTDRPIRPSPEPIMSELEAEVERLREWHTNENRDRRTAYARIDAALNIDCEFGCGEEGGARKDESAWCSGCKMAVILNGADE